MSICSSRHPTEVKRTQELLDAGHGSAIKRTSTRWIGRTKGKAFSRCRLIRTIVGNPQIGMPGAFLIENPTRGCP